MPKNSLKKMIVDSELFKVQTEIHDELFLAFASYQKTCFANFITKSKQIFNCCSTLNGQFVFSEAFLSISYWKIGSITMYKDCKARQEHKKILRA